MKNYVLTTLVVLGLLYSCGNNYDSGADQSILEDAPSSITKADLSEAYAPAEGENYKEERTGNADDELQKLVGNKKDFSEYLASIAAKEFRADTSRKFIRTADMKFRVKNIKRSTYAIEDAVNYYQGFVSSSSINTSTNRVQRTVISKDSVLESTYFTMENTMTLRVPAQHLDTLIRIIAKEVDYLNYRNIQANDITIDLFANKLKKNRLSRFQKRLEKAIDQNGKKLPAVEQAEEALLQKAEQEDLALIEDMRTMDKVEYATVDLYMYERESVIHELIPNDKNIEEYEPGLGSKLTSALYDGWLVVEALLIAIARLWFILLVFGIVIYFIFKKLKPFAKK